MNIEKIEINDFVYNKLCSFIGQSIHKINSEGFSNDRLKVLMPMWFKNALTRTTLIPSRGIDRIYGLEVKENYQDKIVVYVANYQPMHSAFTEIDIDYLINE